MMVSLTTVELISEAVHWTQLGTKPASGMLGGWRTAVEGGK